MRLKQVMKLDIEQKLGMLAGVEGPFNKYSNCKVCIPISIYYTTGLFLLRSSFPTEYLYADVLLNFYKIAELITYKRTNKKPKLDVILKDSKSLNLISVDETDIKNFWKIRSSDSAHDYNKVRGVSRKQAVECKMWVDELIVKDMIDRAEKPRLVDEVQESSSRAIIRPKYRKTE